LPCSKIENMWCSNTEIGHHIFSILEHGKCYKCNFIRYVYHDLHNNWYYKAHVCCVLEQTDNIEIIIYNKETAYKWDSFYYYFDATKRFNNW
jgi:hypothetical protein